MLQQPGVLVSPTAEMSDGSVRKQEGFFWSEEPSAISKLGDSAFALCPWRGCTAP